LAPHPWDGDDYFNLRNREQRIPGPILRRWFFGTTAELSPVARNPPRGSSGATEGSIGSQVHVHAEIALDGRCPVAIV